MPSTGHPGVREALAPLALPSFRFLFLGRTISRFGSALAPVALSFAVLDLTGSASDLGFVLASFSVPQVVFLLVGGVWSDRLPRHHVMVATNLVNGASQGVLAVLLLAGVAEVWHVAALAAVNGLASAFFFPASQGILPQVVPRRQLQEANALMRLAMNGASIGGAAAGGLLVAVVGSGWAIAGDAASFFLCAGLLARIAIPDELRLAVGNFFAELRDGWTEFRSRTWLWVIVVAFGLMNACSAGTFFVLGPLVAKEELGGAAAWGTILAGNSAGFVLGGLIALRLKPQYPLRAAMLFNVLLIPQLALLAVVAPLAAIVVGSVLAGMSIEVFGVLWETALQQHVPTEKLSRVASYDAFGSWVLQPVGYAIVGPIAVSVGVEETLWLAAAFLVVANAVTLSVRDVWTLPRRDAIGVAAASEDAAAEPA